MRLEFDPEKPLANNIRVLENAVVVAWGQGDNVRMARPAGVFTDDGDYVEDAMCFRASTRPTTVAAHPPSPEDIKNELSGTVLFGGLAYGHFGHALCESTARLWALDQFDGKIDSVLFLPKKKFTWPNRALAQTKSIAHSLGIEQPLVAYNEPVRVERLVIAPQGFGVNDMIGASPEFRTFTDQHWRQRVQANGPEKLYISRTEVFRKRGRLLHEEYIERQLIADGFTIFHPQQHDLETQLAHYKAAKVIISTDNSALHLAAFVAVPDCKVAIILRRPGKIFLDFQEQLRRFAGIDPLIIDACHRFWFREGEPVQFNEIIALPDFDKIGRALTEHGYITPSRWTNPTEAETANALEEFQQVGDMSLQEVPAPS
ncbi:glycosyltransferase family 61 protein [Aliiroseovarius sp. Z3]|uniref:glycosyltransferase family 61 protein n=1 Tax=Aliiroseovarius sp. Z3 TaxID=2811402 RepID=UPI0023B28244|nr:glycosyltransferase 61 family protein [Aliiroseovarius sp. Z3]MDE9451614.1 glycosyltransferase family 61 protein [Aliiroseovarius sp. Z3]